MEAEESAFSMTLPHGVFHRNGRPSSVSARKLAASLWSDYSPRSHLQSRHCSSISNSDSPDSVRCPSSKASKTSTRNPSPTAKSPSVGRRRMTASLQRYPFRSYSISSELTTLEVDPSGGYQCTVAGLRTTEPDCRQAFSNARATGRRQAESSSLVIRLTEELKRALARVKELELEQVTARKEVDILLKGFAEEISVLRTNEQERIESAVYSISEQLEKERKSRKKVEVKNRELSSYLIKLEETLEKVEEELEQERKARKLMEDVCNELAKEIGEDKARVDALKREQVKTSAKIKVKQKTRQMLDAFGDVISDIKRNEAKAELEESCNMPTMMSDMKRNEAKIEREESCNMPTMQVNKFLSSLKAHNVEPQGRCPNDPMEKLQTEASRSNQFNDIRSRSETYQTFHKKNSMEESEQEKSSTNALSCVEKKWSNNSLSSGNKDDKEGAYRNKEKELGEWDSGVGNCKYEIYNDSFDCEYRPKCVNMDPNYNEEVVSNWSADCEDETEDSRQPCNYASQGAICDKMFLDASNGVRHDKELHNLETVCKRDEENSECSCDEDACCSATCQEHATLLQMNQDSSGAGEEELTSRYFVVDQHRSRASKSRLQKQKGGLIQGGNYGAIGVWRASVRSSEKGPKPIRSNSLRAKLILEDEMGGG